MSTARVNRPGTLVDLYYMQRMCAEPTPVTLDEVGSMLGLSSRTKLAQMWNNALNYLQGATCEWPPSGPTMGKRLAPGDAGLSWWPSHVAVLPAPDLPWTPARPRWTKGSIHKWMLETGRASWSMDLTPRTPTGGGRRRAPQHAEQVDPVDLDLARTLVGSDELWDLTAIARFFEVTEVTARNWAQCALNRWLGGLTQWPPTVAESRSVVRAQVRGSLLWWPDHQRMLPPPHSVRADGNLVTATDFRHDTEGRRDIGRFLWRAGDIAWWGLHTGRLLADGTVVLLHAA